MKIVPQKPSATTIDSTAIGDVFIMNNVTYIRINSPATKPNYLNLTTYNTIRLPSSSYVTKCPNATLILEPTRTE